MPTRKELLQQVNRIAQMRARHAYTREKAALLDAVRRAAAAGQDVAALLLGLERAELPRRLIDGFTDAADSKRGPAGPTRGGAKATDAQHRAGKPERAAGRREPVKT